MSREMERRLREDRALRNAALELVKADSEHIKRDFSAKNVGSRVATRISEGAVDVFEEAVDVADSNRGVLAALIAAVMLWFARNPIITLFSDEKMSGDMETETAVEPDEALQPETEN